VVAIALLTIRRRPLGNALLLAGVAVAAVGSALAGLGAAGTAVFIAAGVLLLYGGFVLPALPRRRALANSPSR
jgi:Flp pilus assembly protein protease CpaA